MNNAIKATGQYTPLRSRPIQQQTLIFKTLKPKVWKFQLLSTLITPSTPIKYRKIRNKTALIRMRPKTRPRLATRGLHPLFRSQRS